MARLGGESHGLFRGEVLDVDPPVVVRFDPPA